MSVTLYYGYYYNGSTEVCQSDYGADLASIPVSDLAAEYVTSINRLCDSGNPDSDDCCWIGLSVNESSCIGDDNYALQWTDGTLMNQSLIDTMWCDGYPLHLCNDSTIYLRPELNCLQNGKVSDPSNKCKAICGDPYICKDDIAYLNYLQVSQYYYIIVSLICFIMAAFIGFKINSWFRFIKNSTNLNSLHRPSKLVKCTAITYPLLQCIQYLMAIIAISIPWISCSKNHTKSLLLDYNEVNHPGWYHFWEAAVGIGLCALFMDIFIIFPVHLLSRYDFLKVISI